MDWYSWGIIRSSFRIRTVVKANSHVADQIRMRRTSYLHRKEYYALINRARGPYEEIFVLTFKAYGPNAVRSMRLERQNKYFPYGPRSRLIRALLYTHYK